MAAYAYSAINIVDLAARLEALDVDGAVCVGGHLRSCSLVEGRLHPGDRIERPSIANDDCDDLQGTARKRTGRLDALAHVGVHPVLVAISTLDLRLNRLAGLGGNSARAARDGRQFAGGL